MLLHVTLFEEYGNSFCFVSIQLNRIQFVLTFKFILVKFNPLWCYLKPFLLMFCFCCALLFAIVAWEDFASWAALFMLPGSWLNFIAAGGRQWQAKDCFALVLVATRIFCNCWLWICQLFGFATATQSCKEKTKIKMANDSQTLHLLSTDSLTHWLTDWLTDWQT